MDYGQRLALLVDARFAIQEQQTEDGLRTHLGASVIGEKCLRAVWFGWRWAGVEDLPGRMFRLFSRGHHEEEMFAHLLRLTGATVWTQDAQGKQFRISAFGGHFGGSLDGVAVNLPDVPADLAGLPALCEFKTHNDKSFKDLKKKQVKDSKPKHYKQAQMYMRKMDLKWCLYCAVNKNDDELYFEVVRLNPNEGDHLLNRAEYVITTREAPPRISETSSWFECRFCKFKEVCHFNKEPLLNCRTCVHSAPLPDGTWHCALGNPEIIIAPKQGCPSHSWLPSLHRV